jgi:hypothetical protein
LRKTPVDIVDEQFAAARVSMSVDGVVARDVRRPPAS